MPRVRILRDVLIGSRTQVKGDMLDVAPEVANDLFETRAAVLADDPRATPTPDQIRRNRLGQAGSAPRGDGPAP